MLAALLTENCNYQKDRQIISSDSLYYNADRSTSQELQNFDVLKGTDITSQTFPLCCAATQWTECVCDTGALQTRCPSFDELFPADATGGGYVGKECTSHM